MNECKYCKENSHRRLLDSHCEIAGRENQSIYCFIAGYSLYIGDDLEEYEERSVDINYCPMCGRKL